MKAVKYDPNIFKGQMSLKIRRNENDKKQTKESQKVSKKMSQYEGFRPQCTPTLVSKMRLLTVRKMHFCGEFLATHKELQR